MNCWAASISACNGGQSAEHYFSRGLFKGKNITVSGFEWLDGKPKEIGVASLTVKNLCRFHNTELAGLDASAITLFKDLEELVRVQEVRKKFAKRKYSRIVTYKVDGLLFERWAAKFLIGIFAVVGREGDTWHFSRTGPELPPEELVKAAFDVSTLKKPFGLYAVQAPSEEVTTFDGVGISPLLDRESRRLLGALIYFQGFRFMIWVSNGDPEEYLLEEDNGMLFGRGHAAFLYHPKGFQFKIGGKWSQTLKFIWEQGS
jgi:hypothetical protein